MSARLTRAALERARIEAVTNLTGGELASRTWRYRGPSPARHKNTRHYWYEGVPDWCSSDYALPGTYRTVIVDETFGEVSTPRGWVRVAHYDVNPETGCTWCDHEGTGEGTGDRRAPSEGGRTKAPRWPEVIPKVHRCPLCEGSGTVYVGEGYREVILYREPRAEWSAYRLAWADVWGNARDGYDVNEWLATGVTVFVKDDEHRASVIGRAVSLARGVAAPRRGPWEVTGGDYVGDTLYLDRGGRPMYRLDYIGPAPR